jgi:hypothetical protein
MNVNQAFCSILLADVRCELSKVLPVAALKGINAYCYGSNSYEVTIPKNQWFPKGYFWNGKAQYVSEAKATALCDITERIEKKAFEDSRSFSSFIYNEDSNVLCSISPFGITIF